MRKTPLALIMLTLLFGLLATPPARAQDEPLAWDAVTELPDGTGGEGQAANLGMAGPFVGLARDTRENLPDGAHAEVLLVAGGANFPILVGHALWDAETYKHYYDTIWVMTREAGADGRAYDWLATETTLPSPRAYGASTGTPLGVLCVGGVDEPRDAQGNIPTDAEGNELPPTVFADAYLLRWDAEANAVTRVDLPPMPLPSAYGAAAVVGNTAYIIVGQTGPGLDSATDRVLALDLERLSFDDDGALVTAPKQDDEGNDVPVWEEADPIPGGARAHTAVAAQHNGFHNCLYIIGGRRMATDGDDDADLVAVKIDGSSQWYLYHDVWEFNPGSEDKPWRQRADILIDGKPTGLTAGSAVPVGQSHIFVVSGSTGANIRDAMGTRQVGWADYYDENGVSRHPGFSRAVLSYHAITDTWTTAGQAPTMDDPESGSARQIAVNAVTTPAVRWGDQIIIASGEVRPKVRSPKVWEITVKAKDHAFGAVNFTVLVMYLLAMVGVGVFFVFKNKNTDDYFRGGKSIPWWVAGCSIFATMLSSITYMAIPAKAYATDLVYMLGNFMIFAIAPVAVFVALPFFRRIDATSAYEYLEKRFSFVTRLFASGCFTLYHIFRMGVVLALASQALAVITPLDPWQCVLVMGVLCLIYCTLGGIEAVVWTDTIQTFVLMGGALLCLYLAFRGAGEVTLGEAADYGKTKMADWDFGASSFTTMALWVVLIGAAGQNLASYTADQAVVQRYMTTPRKKDAARAIWLNAWMAIPAALIFYGMGIAFWMFYRANPEQLDPTFTTDRIMPLFISQELPIGIAGLVVAGIFAAAQSTVSTSMNSAATTLVTDFLRPFNVCKSERSYFRAAQGLTLAWGVLGTLAGLLFISPDIKSYFDEFITVLGMFLGVLGGLFVLGVMTKRGNGKGAMAGALTSFALMMVVYFTRADNQVSGYLYATLAITTCVVVGYVVSLVTPGGDKPQDGLTIYSMDASGAEPEAGDA